MRIIALFVLVLGAIVSNAQEQTLPLWKPGMLDIHHIQTGRGDAAFFIFPDGTTMIVDAGDMSETYPRITSPRNTPLVPDDSKTAGEWIADYIKQFHPDGEEAVLDYAIVTHFHDDHFGEIDHTSKKSKWGDYLISGITEVGEHIPINKLIDRDYPEYNFPFDQKSEEYQQKLLAKKSHYDSTIISSMDNYWKFIEYQKNKRGLVAEQISVGSKDQIILRKSPSTYPDFRVRNICGNGIAWSGWDGEAFELVPQEILPGSAIPGENSLSIGLKISYGEFDYFTGGDIAGNDSYGEGYLESVEAQVAPVIGPVDVATLNHHGNRDSQSAFYVRTIRPKVWIGQTWSSDHPGDDVLRRISLKNLYPGERYIFSTAMLEANRLVIGDRIDRMYQSSSGHIVVRVEIGGESYMLYVLDENDPERKIKKSIGPIKSR